MKVWEDICRIGSDPSLLDPVLFALTVVVICTAFSFGIVFAIKLLCRFFSWLFTTPPPQADLTKGLLSYFEEDRDWVWDPAKNTLTHNKMVLYVYYITFDKMWVLNQVNVNGEGFDRSSFTSSDWKHIQDSASEKVSDFFIDLNKKRAEEALVHLQHVPTADSMIGMLKRIEELEKKISS